MLYNNMYNTSGNITYNNPIVYGTTNVGYVPISKLESGYSTRIYGSINDDEDYILASSDEKWSGNVTDETEPIKLTTY